MSKHSKTYNERYATVLVYVGLDHERLEAWRSAAKLEGLTVGKWLAKLADEACGRGKDQPSS